MMHSILLQTLMNVLKECIVVLRCAKTHLEAMTAPVSLVTVWQVMDKHVIVSLIHIRGSISEVYIIFCSV